MTGTGVSLVSGLFPDVSLPSQNETNVVRVLELNLDHSISRRQKVKLGNLGFESSSELSVDPGYSATGPSTTTTLLDPVPRPSPPETSVERILNHPLFTVFSQSVLKRDFGRLHTVTGPTPSFICVHFVSRNSHGTSGSPSSNTH